MVLGLTRCEATIDRQAFWRLFDPPKKEVDRLLHSECRIGAIRPDYFDLTATCTLEVRAQGAKNAPLRVHGEFEVHFHGRQPVNAALVGRFAGAEARLFMWPYFREFISATMGRMSVPPFLIPMSYSLPRVRLAKRSKTAARS